MGFDIDLLGPPEEDDALAHYGVKGMRWGHRKPEDDDSPGPAGSSSKDSDSSSSSKSGGSASSGESKGLTDGQKKALKYAAGGALVAGAILGTAVLARNGKIPISSLQSSAFNKNSFAAETRRMEKIPGTFAYNQKMAKIPGSLQSETKRLAQIPGTYAHREAQLASAMKTSATMNPEARINYMQRVTARLDEQAQRRATVQANRTRRIAELAAERSREADMAARRQIVRNQGNALARSGDRNRLQSAVDGVSTRADSRRATRAMSTATNAQQQADAATERKKSAADGGSSRLENVQTLIQAASMGRDAVNSIRSSQMWNQPATNLQGQTTQTQRQQIVAAQRRAAENERNAQNRSRRGRN